MRLREINCGLLLYLVITLGQLLRFYIQSSFVFFFFMFEGLDTEKLLIFGLQELALLSFIKDTHLVEGRKPIHSLNILFVKNLLILIMNQSAEISNRLSEAAFSKRHRRGIFFQESYIRPTAAVLKNHRFFKNIEDPENYIIEGFRLYDLPPVAERFEYLQQKRKEKLIGQFDAFEEASVSHSRVTSWDFDSGSESDEVIEIDSPYVERADYSLEDSSDDSSGNHERDKKKRKKKRRHHKRRQKKEKSVRSETESPDSMNAEKYLNAKEDSESSNAAPSESPIVCKLESTSKKKKLLSIDADATIQDLLDKLNKEDTFQEGNAIDILSSDGFEIINSEKLKLHVDDNKNFFATVNFEE